MDFSSEAIFSLNAWTVAGRHVGVHSPHPHRNNYHLQVTENGATRYEELFAVRGIRFYMEVFERAVREVFGVNAWQAFA